MKKFKIVNENEAWVAYIKRKIFGWKQLTPHGLPTIYAALKFISNNYDIKPLFVENSDNIIEIVND